MFGFWKFEDNRPGEKVIVTIKRHPIVLLKGFLIILVIIAVMILVVYFYKFSLITLWDIVLGLVSIAVITYYYLFIWYNDLYVLTNQRLIDVDQYSFFSRTVTETALDQIQEVKVEVKGPLESIFGYGKIVIITAGPQQNLVLEVTPRPFNFQKVINKAFYDYRNKVGITVESNESNNEKNKELKI